MSINKTATPEEIGKRIRIARNSIQLTQQKLADLIPVGRITLTNWENGKSKPKTEQILELSKHTNVPAAWIAFGITEDGEKLPYEKTEIIEIIKALPREHIKAVRDFIDMIVKIKREAMTLNTASAGLSYRPDRRPAAH